ncbi:MAG TPA: protein-methionine-sulfoxide reductase heme-binding subunit MsrQ [Tepidisphaeraceae bacterium]|jgi:sulfoxide reductase heme-binding subunit YedZ
MKDPEFAKFVLLVNGAVPGALLAWDASQHQLGANPVNHAIHITGSVAVVFIALTLAITPVRKITGWNWLSHFRRMLGLYAFFYALAHFLIYFAFQQSFHGMAVIRDAVDHPFIFFGMTALTLMIPLALTSTNGMIKRMGAKKWKNLHKLVYIVAIAAAFHFWMSTKVVGIYQEIFAGAVIVLLGYRLVVSQIAEYRKAHALAGAGSA